MIFESGNRVRDGASGELSGGISGQWPELVVSAEAKKKRGKDKRTKDLSAVYDHNSLKQLSLACLTA